MPRGKKKEEETAVTHKGPDGEWSHTEGATCPVCEARKVDKTVKNV